MKKKYLILPIVLSAFVVLSCKSAPAQPLEEPEAPPALSDEAAFHDAYYAVLPLIMEGAESYTVKSGDTLTKIARAKYGRGNAFFFPLIMAASKAGKTVDIVDPDLIVAGMELIIPNLNANRNDPEIRERIKNLLQSVRAIYESRPETRWSSELIDGLLSAENSL
ncbi:MAG: LysM peptidoglycan-binding domain-containing protein [Treponema sp.]|jgi:hypothetical protein|nr:LysM peptidoglycan-binding domain-containing protein [Treponema sp.]